MFYDFLDKFNKYFNIDNRTTLPVIITLFVFTLGWLLNGLSNSFKESKKRKVTKRILKKTLLELAINVKAEVKNCHKASKTFVSSNTSNFSLKKSNFSQLSIFREIGYKELFDTYYKGIFNIE